MIVLVGESASGKSSIERELVEKHGYCKLVSYTTRPPRKNEVDGVDYNFISEEEFQKLKDDDFFLESAEYRGWHYGTAKIQYTDEYFGGKPSVAVLTPHGLRQLMKLGNSSIISFYINVPRRDRMIQILNRGDDIDEAYRRNLADVGMFDGIADEVDYVVTNPMYMVKVSGMANTVLRLAGEPNV